MKVLFFANSDWYLYNFRMPLAEYLRERGAEVVMVSPSGEYTRRLEQSGFRCLQIDMGRRSTNPFGELGHIRRMMQTLKAEKPDILHNFTIKSVVYGSIAARLLGSCRVVNAVAGLGYVFSNEGLHARLLRPVVRALLRFAMNGRDYRLILQNPDDRELFLRERLIDPDSIRLILGSGVNTSRFSLSNRIGGERLRVLMACRLLWDKGVQEYADAARILKQKGYNADFVLAGSPDSGNPASVSETDLQRWTQEACVRPVGHLEDMHSYLQSTDIVVLPTRYGEGVPRVLIEAAACGIPLVGTDVPGCREIVRDGHNGILVEPGRADSLAEAIARLLDDSELRSMMGLKGREIVISEFDESVVFRKTAEVYEELLPEWR